MARYDPFRDSLVNDDEQDPVVVITQCEGMPLAEDPAGLLSGRQWDPLAKRYRRTRGGGTSLLRLTRVGMTVTCFGTATHPAYAAPSVADYVLTSDNPLGTFSFGGTGTIILDGIEYNLDQYMNGSIGDVITLTLTFPDTSTASDQETVV